MNIKRQHSEIGLSQAVRYDRASSIQLQKNYKLFYNTAQNQDKLKNYKKIKYQGIIYKIGEFVEIYHLGSNSPYICKLVNIGSIMASQNSSQIESNIDIKCPMVEVEWYFRKYDLSKDPKFNEEYKFISNNEVFASGQTFVLPVEAIMGKCEILTVQQYSELGFIQNSIYFNRASYDQETETLTPNIKDWGKKYCICDTPYNPDMEYIECEKCEKWFHNDCIIRENQDLNNFVCRNCTKKDSLNKKKKK